MRHSAPHRGWVKVYRRVLNAQHPLHPHSNGDEACHLGAWIDLIGYAQWSEDGPLNRGQLEASESFLADRWNWTRKKVRCFIEKLEREKMIRRQTRPGKPSLITIVNYDKYQSGGGRGATRAKGERSAPGTAQGPVANSQTAGATPHSDSFEASKGPGRGTPKGPQEGTGSRPQVEEGRNQKRRCGESPTGDSRSLGRKTTTSSPPTADSGGQSPSLERQVAQVERHWVEWLRHLVGPDALMDLLGQREDARSIFRARLRERGLDVEKLKVVIDYVMQEYYGEDDALPWNGNLHPRSYLQSREKTRAKLSNAENRGEADGSGPHADGSVDGEEARRSRSASREKKREEDRRAVLS